MRILGADGLTVGANALNNISSGYLNDGDVCLAKYPSTTDNGGKIYLYVLKADQGGVENLPNVVVPLDNATVPTDKRWVLTGVYQDEITVQDIYANTLSQALSGTPLVINDTLSLSGDTITFTNDSPNPPFNVNSNVQVNDLNAEYWGGIHWTEFDIGALIKSGDQWINQGVDSVTVYFSAPQFGTTYSLFTELHNETDANPSMYNIMVSNKSTTGFTVKLSGKTDSPYYRIQWAILGDNSFYDVFDLQDAYDNDIADVNGNPFTVT